MPTFAGEAGPLTIIHRKKMPGNHMSLYSILASNAHLLLVCTVVHRWATKKSAFSESNSSQQVLLCLCNIINIFIKQFQLKNYLYIEHTEGMHKVSKHMLLLHGRQHDRLNNRLNKG